MERWFPDRTNLYRQTSGVVHSAPWMLSDAVTSTPLEPDLKLGPDLFGIGAAVLISVDAAGALSAAYAAYYGHDPAPASRARATRTRAMDIAMEKLVVERFSPGG